MKKLSVVALLGATALLFGRAGDVSAGMISIANHSFEAESLPDGNVYLAGGSLELWAGGTVANGDVTGGERLGALIVPESALIEKHFVSIQTDFVAQHPLLVGGELLSIRFVSNGRESEIDNIQLSTLSSSVPEPTSMALLGLASLGGLGLRLRRRCVTNVSPAA